ncbi:MAG TPA: hypothetical protein VM536_08585 [Chloroflexia bacterium]|nr:hypothetical protein [Chloroflexia bacterium]
MTDQQRERITLIFALVALASAVADIISYFAFGHLQDILFWPIGAAVIVVVVSGGLRMIAAALITCGVGSLLDALSGWMAFKRPVDPTRMAIALAVIALGLLLQVVERVRKQRKAAGSPHVTESAPANRP